MVLKNWDFKLTQKESREFYAFEPALFFTASIQDIYTEFTENNINNEIVLFLSVSETQRYQCPRCLKDA